MLNKGPFPMAFTPTSVMIKSSERGGGFKEECLPQEMNINLTPTHMQNRMRPRSGEGPGMPRVSPTEQDQGPKPVPTIETSRGGGMKLPFPPGPFTPPHPMGIKGMPPNFMVHPHHLAKGIPPVCVDNFAR